jgi:predicted PurR-regulated permease PerM
MVSDQTTAAPGSRTGVLVNLAAFVVITAGLKAASDLVILVLAALFLAIAVAPPIFFLQRKGVPFVLGMVIVLSAAIGLLGAMAGLIGTSITQFRRQLPAYEAMIGHHYESLSAWIEQYGVGVELESLLGNLVDPGKALNLAASLFSGVGTVLANGFLIFIMVLFLLLEASSLPGKMQVAFGGRDLHLSQFRQLFESVNRYLVMKTWISLLTGVLAGGLCAVVGVDFPILWGLLAFLLNYIPNVGSILAAIPPTLLALVQLGGGSSLAIIAGFLVINNVLGNILEPRIMGQGLGLSPFAVLLSLVFWGWVLGPVGMLLSIPLTMSVKIAMEGGKDTQWIAVLLGSGDAPKPPESAAEEA